MENKDNINNVIEGNFKLAEKPIAVQLTVHVTNLILTYNKKTIIPVFKEILHNPEMLNQPGSLVVKQIINHYGVETCRKWFTDIYGWDFKKKVA